MTDNISGLYEITDSFGRTYQKTACKSCAAFWHKYRPSCKLVRKLQRKESKECN